MSVWASRIRVACVFRPGSVGPSSARSYSSGSQVKQPLAPVSAMPSQITDRANREQGKSMLPSMHRQPESEFGRGNGPPSHTVTRLLALSDGTWNILGIVYSFINIGTHLGGNEDPASRIPRNRCLLGRPKTVRTSPNFIVNQKVPK